MCKQMIIAIGREYGSGGHEIAVKVAEHFGIPLYDRELIGKVAEHGMISPGVVAAYDEKPASMFLYAIPGEGSSLSMEQEIAYRTFQYLQRQAQKESFVVVGRCANELLKDFDALFSVFVRGDIPSKCKRVMERNHISEKEALLRMKRMDRVRRNYHNFYCEGKWGDSREYDLCINSSKLGVEGCSAAIINAAEVYFRDEP